MKIGIDMDSVLAELIGPMDEFHNALYHTSLTHGDHTDYNLSTVWKCGHEEVLPRILAYYDSPYFDKVVPIEGAVEAVARLSVRHELTLITSRPHTIEQKTIAWLDRYFPGRFKNVRHTNQVSHAHEKRKKKSEVCREEGVTLMIDDHIDYALDCAQVGIQVFLFPAMWNKKAPAHKLIRKVTGWEEITKLV